MASQTKAQNILNLDDENNNNDSDDDYLERKEREQQQLQQQQEQPRKPRVYKKPFGGADSQKVEFACPYSKCGRKFTTEKQLSLHMERRHNPEEEKKQKEQVEKQQAAREANHAVSKQIDKKMPETPLPSRAKVPAAQRQEEEQIDTVVSTPTTTTSSAAVTLYNQRMQNKKAAAISSQKQSTRQQQDEFSAKPKMIGARPQTASKATQKKVGAEQAAMLRSMMNYGKSGSKPMARPRTAATTTVEAENRIKDKLKYFEKLEQTIEQDLEDYANYNEKKKQKQDETKLVTKQMLLTASMCDSLDQIQTILLREKGIEVFDDNFIPEYAFKMDDLCNVECVYASHNFIKEIDGICQLTTLIDLNLSMNEISSISGLEELTLLEKLFLNRNKITVIDPIEKLKSLKCLGLFGNKIIGEQRTLEIFESLPKLKELSIGCNPVSIEVEFTYNLVLRLEKLKILDDETIKELDYDVAEHFFESAGKPVPGPKRKVTEMNLNVQSDKENILTPSVHGAKQQDFINDKTGKKSVRFTIDNETDTTWQEDEIKKLQALVDQYMKENNALRVKLHEKNYEDTYKENEMMKMELKNMYMLVEENKELKAELDHQKNLTYEDRMKEMAKENEQLKKRNGELLFKQSELEDKVEKLNLANSLRNVDGGRPPSSTFASRIQSANPANNNAPLQRPSTSQGAFMRNKDRFDMTDDPNLGINEEEDEQLDDDFDKELKEMIAKNQARLQELHSEMKDIKKVEEEPYVNIRKMKQPQKISK